MMCISGSCTERKLPPRSPVNCSSLQSGGSLEDSVVRPTIVFIEKLNLIFGHGSVRSSFRIVQRLSCEVVERVGEQGEHEDTDPVLMEPVVLAEAWDGLVGGGLVELGAD